MSGYVPLHLTGKIFDNDDKRRSKQPDYSGSCNISGQVFRIVGWRNPPSERERKGNINLKFQDMDEFNREQERRRQSREKPQPRPKPEEDPNGNPF